MEVAAGIAGDDQVESIGVGAAQRPAVAGESDSNFPAFQLPHFLRVVRRGRNRLLPVRGHRHRSNGTRVADEGARFVPARQMLADHNDLTEATFCCLMRRARSRAMSSRKS